MRKLPKKKIAVLIGASIIIVGAVATVTTVEIMHYNSYALKNEKYTIELGNSVEANADVYIKAGNKKAIEETTLDLSKIDILKTGTYEVVAKHNNKELKFEIEVNDTQSPIINLNVTLPNGIVGQDLVASDYVTSVNDLGGIKNIKLSEGESVLVEGTKLEEMKFNFASNGEHTVNVEAEDLSGNVEESKFTVKISKDYITKVDGFKDWSLIEGSSVDFMEGVTFTSDITSVSPRTEGIDLNTVGDYRLVYTINCDDGSVLTKEVGVTVTVKPVVKAPVSTPSLSGGATTPKTSSSGPLPNKDGSPRTVADTGGVVPAGMATMPTGLLYYIGETVAQYGQRVGSNLMGGDPSGRLCALPGSYVIGTSQIVTDSSGRKFDLGNVGAGYIN